MWQEGRIKDETLGWRAGMPDWVALVEIPELQVISNGMGPRAAKAESAEAPADAAPAASPTAAKPGACGVEALGRQRAVVPGARGAAWPRPRQRRRPPNRPPGFPTLGFAGYASGDLFGGQVQSPPPPGAEAAGAAPQWAVPQAKARKAKGSCVRVRRYYAAGVVLLWPP